MRFLDNLIKIDIEKNMGITGLTDEFFCVYLYDLLVQKKKNILVVVNTLFEANKLYSSLSNYTDCAYLFPMDDFLTSEALAISPDLKISRLDTLNVLVEKKPVVVIANLMGYLRFLPSSDTYLDFLMHLHLNQQIEPSSLIEKLISMGYKKSTIVTKTGEFGVRGFVIDIFPIGEENPIRLEFFGDEIESIRYFDAESQKSIKKVASITIRPYSEFLTDKNVDEDHFERQKYLPLYENVVSLADYFRDGYTIFKDYDQLAQNYLNIFEETISYKESKDISFNESYMFEFDKIPCRFPIFYMTIDNLSSGKMSFVIDFHTKTINSFSENVNQINKYIREKIGDKTIIICLKKYQLKSISKKLNMSFIETTFDSIYPGKVNLVEGEFNQGFVYGNVIFLTANELFINKENKKNYSNRFKYSTSIKDLSKLNVGDYVVHNVHGIGIYNGIKVLESNGVKKDYLEILYYGSDKIYIPVEKIDLLSKYSGKEGYSPKINKLGGTEWEKTKTRVRKKINDIADNLIALYTEREKRKGFSFSPDCDMLIDFEKEFPYELTKDQIIAINQIKKDMESSLPMDRLLCGDVGFGKTEVAFVAAFKAILDSKQVLFLCPTTILSNQHYENAKKRFANFPVSIALLNRFTPKSEVNRILSGLSSGTIDLVFGTHRLLSDDVKLKDLGLLVIDEEQRFGVMHKEKIKQYKTNVDVLTLTATPIPRTLQMSLVGIRSLSLIETPPINRYPVQTYVIEENEPILKDAIYKEISRGGQVFILYNYVESIEEEKIKIKKIIPDATIAIAHGQMTKNDLESTIIEFINKKYDILLCTTIIETGIDIPNVNTLIIMDADRFGLSQLYQIRGRVGRSDKFAYAYLMYNSKKILTETAKKRLSVIKEFTELGSGFSIATRDLSIRGAGNILGSEQAGFIDSIGIDLYLKMLNEEVNKKQGQDQEPDTSETQPLIDVATHISDNYVKEDDLKIEIHQMINKVDSRDKFFDIKAELEDRFGKITEDLIIYMYEEWFEKLALKLHIEKVRQTRNSIEIVFSQNIVSKLDIDEVFMDAFHISNMFRFISRGNSLLIVLDIIKLDKHPIYFLVDLLDKIYSKFENNIDLLFNS